MTQNNNTVLTVDEITTVVKQTLYKEPILQNIAVTGEIVGFKIHSSGHVYFSLSGKNSRVSCVMFKSNAHSVLRWPKDGDNVLIRGHLDVYPSYGSYQIYVSVLLPVGSGAKARAKEALKQKLESEGMFDVRMKRKLPVFPRRIALITSLTGAALQDIIKLHSLRYPCAELIIIPSLMQGLGAEQDIINAFSLARNIIDLSCIILTRGGGSRDDLDIFDSENIVKAIRSAPVPVITGLGHQIDTTLADLAADMTAPTPSGAAERLFPDKEVIFDNLNAAADKMINAMQVRIEFMNKAVNFNKERLCNNIINYHYKPALLKLQNTKDKISDDIFANLKKDNDRIAGYAVRLDSVSPLKILSRGYAICSASDGMVIKNSSDVNIHDEISIKLSNGTLSAEITGIK